MDETMSMLSPHSIHLEAGTHALCACGLSKSGNFCDGSHQGSGKVPQILKLEQPKTVYLCNCSASGNQPFCDGSHTRSVSPVATTRKPWWKFWG
ncbi:CDGSH iron-sulfur domain-containing protein [Synechococcus elongatus]|uniref:Zn-finger, CDGSH type n=4 Tax=Synechococcus elongatus TaxID=32046 RepID=Q31MJ2_SYNE7|nr:CDGSH iron-sulfur domain-containing protein [Synechococcus elongatus]MBD2687516.1 CDGSH iron-sulfur domain-containing protein [Synechococcus elongatus FACHB-1061]UOW71516.1 CDGSH iron-sulfur domain-containing protein [Synechococcus elongatus PCC 7943]UOW76958.1 CDGSH iron-sulfur domain-containing protein [Synechococcus elongatus PCC 6301]ABB57727.1 Zn-finger, CDGSH type [Synechococcus elongatus PCC 7942 = FACHB-805]AJD57784.1 hypothetical protein M744_08005 [Synechococcus elongatus UTEX 297